MHTSLKIEENIPLGPLTTLKIGGPARFFVRAETEEDVIAAFAYAREKDLPVFVLGGGSNILVADSGFDGLVIQITVKGISGRDASVNERVDLSEPGAVATGFLNSRSKNTLVHTRVSAREIITAQAGEDWDQFVDYCINNSLAGVENLSGIPGLVGGTPIQNVGAYGQEVSETIVSVKCLDRSRGEIVNLANVECGFAYRTSIFNTTERDRYVVLSVTYALEKDGPPKVVYKDLREYFGEHQPSLKETRDAVLKIRGAKSMVIDPADPNSQSAGSFFKNPIVSNEKYSEILSDCESVPSFKIDERMVKIPAAWLIERSGFHKGYVLGRAGISENHTLAIINLGGATAAEVLAMKDNIQTAVNEKFGIFLQPEPIFVGF